MNHAIFLTLGNNKNSLKIDSFACLYSSGYSDETLPLIPDETLPLKKEDFFAKNID